MADHVFSNLADVPMHQRKQPQPQQKDNRPLQSLEDGHRAEGGSR